MKYALFLSLTLMSIILLILTIATVKANDKNSKSISRLLFSGFITILVYAISILMMNQLLNKIFMTFYFISFDWMLFFLFNFILDYSDRKKSIDILKRIEKINAVLLTLAFADTISLFLNLFLNHCFDNVLYYNATYKFFFWVNKMYRGNQFHLFFCYIIVLMVFGELIYEIIISKKEKRRSYVIIIFILGIIVFSNIFFVIAAWIYDYSVMLYGILTGSIFYSAIYATKKNFLNTMTELYSDNIFSAVFCFDSEKNCIFTNNNAYSLFQDEEQVQYISTEYLSSPWLQAALANKSDIITGNDSFNVRGEQRFYAVEYRILKDKAHKGFGSYLKFTDITDTVLRNNHEKNQLSHDTLTGLLNEAAFMRRAAEIIHSDPLTPRYLIATNIKDFKFINDIFGSELGDKILCEQASMFAYMKYKDCISGRIAADRFAILIRKENFNAELAIANSNQLMNITKSLNYHLRIKLGVYEIQPEDSDVYDMYDKALIAIDSVKDSYKTELKFYDQKEFDILVQNKKILGDFKDALINNEFEVFFQPVVNKDKQIVSYEALSRWNKDGKQLMPHEFIDILSKSILVGELDEKILDDSCKFIKNKLDGGEETFVSINITEMDFYYFNVYKTIQDTIEKYKIPKHCLGIEINESILHNAETMETICELRNDGFVIIVDSFGNGFSSFSTFARVNPSYIKIDVDYMAEDANKDKVTKIVKAMLQFSSLIDTKIIAKHVESESDLNFLLDCGCELFQGNYFYQPEKWSRP